MSTTDIAKEIQSFSPSALIELFVLDYTNLQFPGVLYFHAGTNEAQNNIVWDGQSYIALPIEAEGFDLSTKGTLPRPKIRIANINGMFSAEVSQNSDLVGCKIIRKRTFARYLDAVNFNSGVNPTADPNQHFPDEMWFVDQKVSENKFVIEWELSSAFDLNGVMLPTRQVIQNSCPWKYKGVECNYRGSLKFTSLDVPTNLLIEDVCGKRLTSCKLRQVGFSGGVLPFGGFPGANRFD
jgi:lambda family phage minor tail protein L